MGVSKLKSCFEKNAYTSIEVAKAIVDVDNSSCDGEVSSIVMQLKQRVRLMTGHHTYNRSYNILKLHFGGVEKKGEIEGLEVAMNLAESKQVFHDHGHADIKPLDHDERILAEHIQPTTNGQCVNIQYELQIKLVFDGV